MRDWLYQLRKAKGITMREIAGKIGHSESYYQRMEQGQRKTRMDIALLAKIAEATGEDVIVLVGKEMQYEGIRAKVV